MLDSYKAEIVYKSLNGLSPDCKFIARSDINNRDL